MAAASFMHTKEVAIYVLKFTCAYMHMRSCAHTLTHMVRLCLCAFFSDGTESYYFHIITSSIPSVGMVYELLNKTFIIYTSLKV